MESGKKHLKIAVIGRSGAGKTTFINCLINHMFDIKYEQDRMIAITQRIEISSGVPGSGPIIAVLKCTMPQFLTKQSEIGGSQSQSQTTPPTLFDLESNNFRITVVDTPGIGDTNGMDADQKHCNNICSAVASLSDLNALVLVHKSHDCRTDVMLKYLYREMQSILPLNCQNNLLVVFTAVENPTKIDAIGSLKEMGIPIDSQNYFKFENNSIVPKQAWLNTNSDEGQFVPKKLLRLIDNMEDAWLDAGEECKRLFHKIGTLIPVSAEGFLEISIKKKAIGQLVSKHYHKTVDLEQLVDNLDKKIQECQAMRKTAEENKDFKIQQTRSVRKEREVQKSRVSLHTIYPGKLVYCYVCRVECHDPCSLAANLRNGDASLMGCEAFGGNESTGRIGKQTCKICKHGVHNHSHSFKTRVVSKYMSRDFYYEYEPFETTDLTKEQIFISAQSAISSLEKDVRYLEGKKSQILSSINQSYRTIAFLQSKLRSLAVSSENEFLPEFLEYRRNEVHQDPLLNHFQRRRKLENIERSAQEYELVQKAVQQGKQGLSKYEIDTLEYKIKLIEAEHRAMAMNYSYDRRVFKKH